MRAFGEQVILRPATAPTVNPGGVIELPSAGSEYKCRGYIIDVGPDVKEGHGLEIDDELVFEAGNAFTVDGIKYITIHADKILVVI